MMWSDRRVQLVAAATLLWGATGCGGIGPGDYIVYRIAMQETEMGTDCYVGGQMPPDTQDDSSSLYTSGTFILYSTADDTFYLDTGSFTLKGMEVSDDTYKFEGVETNVEYIGVGTTTRETTSNTKTVDFAVDGEVVDGTYREFDEYDCAGTSCPTPDHTSCTRTTPFVGTEVEDVQIKHEV